MSGSFNRIEQAAPPIARNQTLVAGAIKWARSLLSRCKGTWARFAALEPQLLLERAGKEVPLQERSPHGRRKEETVTLSLCDEKTALG